MTSVFGIRIGHLLVESSLGNTAEATAELIVQAELARLGWDAMVDNSLPSI